MPSWQSYLIKPTKRLLRARHSIEEQTFAELRAANDAMASRYTFPRDVVYEPTVIEGLPAACLTVPGTGTWQVILYFHGGAYVSGSLFCGAEACVHSWGGSAAARRRISLTF